MHGLPEDKSFVHFEYLYEKLGTDCFKPPKILKDKVSRGDLGKKTGQGFYTY